MGICTMNSTIDYYNRNAETYFDRTADVDFEDTYKRFLQYVPDGGRIMDLGCGSGRDVKWFCEHGYNACGLDASEELATKARDQYGITVDTGLIEEWIAEEPYDGVWCCASLMHIDEEGCRLFFDNLQRNLKTGGALYVSVKSGIKTGTDESGRYFRNFSEEDIPEMADGTANLEIKELWYTDDSLARTDFRWLNLIVIRK